MPTDKKVHAVLFDLDGTLIDTAEDFAAVLNHMRHARDLDALPFPTIRGSVSEGARALVTLAFDVAEGEPEFEPLRAELLALYEQQLSHHSALFPGMGKVLAWLERHQVPWGIVTNKPERYATPLVAALGLDSRCHTLICPDHVQARKPDPEGVLMACTHIGCDPAHTVYVGDHQRDIEAGRRAGMRTVGCRYGYVRDPAEFEVWNADVLISQPEELIDWLTPRIDVTVEALHCAQEKQP